MPNQRSAYVEEDAPYGDAPGGGDLPTESADNLEPEGPDA